METAGSSGLQDAEAVLTAITKAEAESDSGSFDFSKENWSNRNGRISRRARIDL